MNKLMVIVVIVLVSLYCLIANSLTKVTSKALSERGLTLNELIK